MNIDDKAFLEKLVSVVPSSRQMKWQQMEYYNFVHFGMSTMLNKQWGTGKTMIRKGETIGYKEIVTELNTVCDGILLVVEKSRLTPHLLPIEIYSEV